MKIKNLDNMKTMNNMIMSIIVNDIKTINITKHVKQVLEWGPVLDHQEGRAWINPICKVKACGAGGGFCISYLMNIYI